MRAVIGYDPRRKTRFSTYAAYWIRQSIRRALVNSAKVICLPSYVTGLLVKYRRALVQLHYDLGRVPTPEEIARHLKLTSRQSQIVAHALQIQSVALQTKDTGKDIDEIWKDTGGDAPDSRLEETDEAHLLLRLVADLDGRQAAVLRRRFGLGGERPRTLNQIGTDLGLTRERVRQIEREALTKLRESLRKSNDR
jgi:RNA polymerase primary sigma factor